ncbi:thiamine-phosphate kinase [bacterium]
MYKSLNQIGEFSLIEKIKDWLKNKNDKTIIGIGDDAAVVPSFKHPLVISKDALIEGTHFTKKITSFYDLGWKSLGVNISDISAMGAKPYFALIAIAAPKNLTLKQIKEFYNGFKALADITKVQLIGGDTIHSRKDIMVSVTIIGKISGKKPIRRSTAKPGDAVCATGTFGDSAYGLYLLKKGKKDKLFSKRFNRPMPRWEYGAKIGKFNLANAMMDVSDGLVSTINEIMAKSKTGCNIMYDKIPVNKNLIQKAGIKKAMSYALYGGEDYELVFTVPKQKLKKVTKILPDAQVIGSVTKGKKITFLNKQKKPLKIRKKGYTAF